jgi:type I restriction enzyme M protein
MLKTSGEAAVVVGRDKTSLDIFWLRDRSLADLDNLPDPDELAGDIIDNLEVAVESFKEIAQRLWTLSVA